MSRAPIRWAVALDGGTTNTRARLLQDGQVVATARRAVGIRDSVRPSGRETLLGALRDAIREVIGKVGGVRPDVIIAAGMLSSEVGLATVPHVAAPAGPEELARGAIVREFPEIAEQPILFVPGVRTPGVEGEDGWASADVMRGEECETLGAWTLLRDASTASPDESGGEQGPGPSATAFLWPGSHTKLIEVDGAGRILRSTTTLAGELTMALARNTLLSASLPESLPDVPDPEAIAAGARIVAREGLGRAAFLVRVAALSGALDLHRRASFWIGAVIADDVAHLAAHPILGAAGRIWVGGRQPQRSLYAQGLRERGANGAAETPEDVAEESSARGALAVAQRHRARFGA